MNIALIMLNFPGHLVSIAGWIAVGLLGAVIAGHLYVAALRLFVVHEPPPEPFEGEHPDVLVQIPLYNEPSVVEGALHAACAFEWPQERLHIQLLDDSTDETSQIAARLAEEYTAAGFDVQHVRRDNREGFKAGALENGLRLSDVPYAAVLDADFRAPPEWLAAVVSALHHAPRAAFCQSRNVFVAESDNWLTRAQRVLQDAHYAVEQPARAWRGLPFQFNGTGGVWRVAAVQDAGGWSHDTLAEDLDLVLRCFLRGWGGVYIMEPNPVGLVPHGRDEFATQQQRWSKGIVQVGRKLWRPIITSRWNLEAKIVTLLMFFGHFMFPAMLMLAGGFVGSSVLFTAVNGGLLIAMGLLALAGISAGILMTAPGFFILKRGSVFDYIKTVLSFPVVTIFLAFANAGAVLRGARGHTSEFVRTPKGKVD